MSRDHRVVDLIYLLAAVASASVVAAANYYLVEPVSLTLLYAVPVGLVSFRFGYHGSAMGSAAALILTIATHHVQPGSLFFDALVLSLALVAVAGMLLAKIGIDRSAESHGGVDPATGLASRRAMVGALSLEMTRCARYSRPISAMLIGLDESTGAGASVVSARLREVGHLVERSVRDVDVVGSYAERELLAILPETRKEDAVALGERLHQSMERLRATLPAARGLPDFTVSIAVTGYPEDSLSVSGLLDSLDETLFKARTLGGNRVQPARRLQVLRS